MTDATHFPVPTRSLSSRLDRVFTSFVKIAAFDRTRQDLVRLSETDDSALAARGLSREAAVRNIIGGRGMF
ncbi:hypothetical protein ACVDG3_08210 [Meridianimarinicoccus sp. RP-17]|uniref:hypothetical protein n=1 Tax=Meridianimarinicoccus zhengii TaxID=2056810 RepID=UPI000DAE7697|nr:hypothetical protein [Phycocomes zhengii]